MEDCLICERINWIKNHKNKYLVKELETGYVVIGDHQFFKGYTLFLYKEHITELHYLDIAKRKIFLEEMSIVGEAVFNAFKADKMNYELLGNGDAHLHWHMFPRFNGDTDYKGPVWWTDKEIMFSDDVLSTDSELEMLKNKVLVELEKLVLQHLTSEN